MSSVHRPNAPQPIDRLGWVTLRGLVARAAVVAGTLPLAAWAGVAEEASVYQYAGPSGEAFAVGLRANEAKAPAGPMRHVVLLDTSASQLGQHREHALSVLDAALAGLPADDRVHVIAYDVTPTSLTGGTLSARAARDVVASKMSLRIPAGSSDLLAALEKAAGELGEGVPAEILLIGDGMSVAKLMKPEALDRVLTGLRERGVAVNVYGVGSRLDKRSLGIIAHQTGGFLMADDGDADPVEAGHAVATGVRELPTPLTGVAIADADYVSRPLPLRTDRETFVLGTGVVEGPFTATAESGEEAVRPGERTTAGNTFLGGYVAEARSAELLNPLAGVSQLRLARQQFEDRITALEALGYDALSKGDTETAERVGTLIQQADPENVRGQSIFDAATKGMSPVAMLQEGDESPFTPAPADPQPPADPFGQPVPEVDAIPEEGLMPPGPIVEDDPFAERAGERPLDPIGDVTERERILGERLSVEVNEYLREARRLILTDPDAAESVLQQARGAVKAEDRIDPALRQRLLRVLQFELQDVVSRNEAVLAQQQRIAERNAEIESQQRLVDALVLEEERLKQLTDQVRALIAEGYAGDPDAFEEAEAVARVIVDEQPGNATGAAALFTSEAAGQLDKAFRLRAVRADQFLATLYQVELSHIPFPDRPPILYPDAATWARISETRQKYRSTALTEESATEERIARTLEQEIDVEFVGSSLADAVEYWEDLYQIPIKIKTRKLEEDGLSSEEEFSLVLSGIKMRNALDIILQDEIGGLTYVVENEVLWITTDTDADAGLQTRIYPVADLVITPAALQQSAGAGGGGGLGGAGGGLGGGAGGGLGGGGLGGGGLGGGGGGLFMVPAADADAKKKAE